MDYGFYHREVENDLFLRRIFEFCCGTSLSSTHGSLFVQQQLSPTPDLMDRFNHEIDSPVCEGQVSVIRRMDMWDS